MTNWLKKELERVERLAHMLPPVNESNGVASAAEQPVAPPPGSVTSPAAPTVTLPADQLQVLAGMVASQLTGIVKVATDDIIKGNFSGAWGDVKGQLANAAIADAIQATRVLEQQLVTHIAGLGTSKQLDIAKGKISDAFIWIEKHLGIGG